MQLFGISSYPVRWRRFLWVVSLLDILIVLEGIGTLAWFLSHPSEPGSRVFLAYSLERWILILATVAIIFGFLFVLWSIKFRVRQVEGLINFFEQPKQTGWLLVSVTFIFVLAAGLMIWLPRNEVVQPYYARLLPLILWGMAIVAQVWIFLMVLMRQTVVQTFKDFIPVEGERQIYPIRTTNKYLFLVLIGISLVYLVLQVKSYLEVREAVLIGDSWSYLYGAGLDLNDPAFFSERRPWGILLIYKILGNSQTAIEIFQLSLSTLAWLWLSWTFARSLKNQWIKLTGFVVTLGFSLTPTVQLWNHTVLSESLSISLMVLILAVFVQLSQQWKPRYLFWLILFFVLWMSFREANAYIALFVALALLIMGFSRRTFRAYWLLSVFIGLAFLVNYQLSSAYGLPRWALPLAEVITHRILPDQEYLEYFSVNGMPVTPELMAFSGKNANSDNYAIINTNELKKFSRWLFKDARNVYVKFLLTHPIYTITSPLVDIRALLGYDYLEGFHIPNYIPTLPKQVDNLFYPVSWFWPYLWVSLLAAGFILVANLRIQKGVYWIIVVFLLLSLPQLYLIWHGDALDVERHAVVMNIQFHLGLLWLVIFHVDKVITKTSRPVAVAASGS
ncbi:MAG: hypothetical protein JW963_24620 [Anaerolineales bacterium]|nr:hypothetical protein [Anaerolineales bacterium]